MMNTEIEIGGLYQVTAHKLYLLMDDSVSVPREPLCRGEIFMIISTKCHHYAEYSNLVLSKYGLGFIHALDMKLMVKRAT